MRGTDWWHCFGTKMLPVVWNQGSGMLSDFKEKGVSYNSIVGGALLATDPEALSFLPAARREEQIYREQNRQMGLAGGAFLGALLCVTLFFIINLAVVSTQLSRIKSQVKQIEAEARVAEKALTKLEIVGSNYENKEILLSMIRELVERTPTTVTLTQLLLEEGQVVKIRGLATKNHIVDEYVGHLEKSDLFGGVKKLFSKLKRVERQDFYDFQIDLVLNGRGL